jgi:endonuclease YncB( thermonuclease family)
VNIKAVALCAVITLSACGGAQAASITTAATPTTTKATTTTVAPTTTTVEPTTTTVMPTPVAPTATAVALSVASVVDGDTLDLSDGTVIRLIGIDTPERDQCGSGEATAVMAGLVTGFVITLLPGARDDVDRYGRLLRYVEANGIDVNLAMIESGRAIARYDGRDGYGEHPRQAAYVAADEATPSLNQCIVPLAAPVPSTPAPTTPATTTPPIATPAPTTPPAAGVYYKNCTAVRAAGAAPIHAGDPGWQTKFDGDGDGVGCE